MSFLGLFLYKDFISLGVAFYLIGPPIQQLSPSFDGLERDPLHFIERDLVAAPILKAGAARRLMAGHLLGDL